MQVGLEVSLERILKGGDEKLHVTRPSPCDACHARRGKGTVIEEPCSACSGRGVVERIDELTVKVPVGAEEGMLLRIPGHGLPSTEPGGTSGDLLIVLQTSPDERFLRRGADLYRLQSISVPDAVLGTIIDVPTLEGKVTATVPRGTQPRAILRLRHKGLPRLGERGRGDIFVELAVRIPEVSREEAALYARLRTLGKSGTREAGRQTRYPDRAGSQPPSS